jgi:cytidylate kinase-like protein
MGTVTIAATYGAGGSMIGPAVAKRLKLPFIDRAIPVGLAEKINEPLVAALTDDSESGSAVGRLLNSALSYSGLFVGVPVAVEELGVVPDVAHTELAIRRLADGGGAVILGRAGVFVLQGRPHVLHVRLDGDIEARRRAAMAYEGLDYKTAARKQQETDQARRAYVAHFYPRSGAWEDARHYHLVLDSTAISIDVCVEIITRAAKDLLAT